MQLEGVVNHRKGLPYKQGATFVLILACLGLSSLRPATAAEADEARAPLPSDVELERSGAVFGEIHIDNKDVFDKSDPKDNKALFRLADKLHVVTRKSVIRHQLLFRSGDH